MDSVSVGSASVDRVGIDWRRVRVLRWALLPSLAVCLVAAPTLPAMGRSALPTERALLSMAIALSLAHAAQNAAARNVEDPAADLKDKVQVVQESPPGSPAADPRATAPGGPNGPDDRNLGSGGAVGGTVPAPPGAVQDNQQGSGGATGSSGSSDSPMPGAGESGSGSEGNDANPPSPAPQQ
jgi:hypothetical protein